MTFVKEVRTELKKATWPSAKEVRGTTIVVVATSSVFAVFLWLVDILVRQVVSGIMNFFSA